MMSKETTIFSLGRPAFAAGLFITLLTSLALGRGGKAIESNPERDKALAEADKKAFEENMAAYDGKVKPFMEKHCFGCHGPKKQKGDLDLTTLDPDMKEGNGASRWAVVREKLDLDEMPPDDEDRPDPVAVQDALAWIKAEMKRSRRNFTSRIHYLNANKVPHADLFFPEEEAELDAPPRLRRHSPEIYETFRKEAAKGFEGLVGNPFSRDPRFLFGDMGTPKVDEPTTSQLLRNAVTIVKRQTAHTIKDGEFIPSRFAKKEFIAFVDPAQPLTREMMEKAVTMEFRHVLARNPREAELERFIALMEKNVKDAGRTSGVRYTLAAVFLLPDSVFRRELGATPDGEGRARLQPEEIAHALAYALTDKRPGSLLLDAAAKGKLDDEAGVRELIDALYDDPKLQKPRILRFFQEFFEYHKASEVFKNTDVFSHHNARVLVSDADNLVRWILERDKDVIAELLSTDKAFVNTRYDSNKKQITQYESGRFVHLSYSLPPDWKWTPEQPVTMPDGTRAGILTHPAWLVSWSMNQDNHAILRGKFVRERLLGNVVPDIPITVDAQLPHAPEKTLRERMAVTREEYCWQCHKLMNPVGLPFETYDHFGRWRGLELGKPVDASGRIDLVGDKRLDDLPVENATDFVRKLAKSPRVEEVFVRHAFRYFLGRNENQGDGPTLRAAHKAYQENSGSFRALVTSLLTSESFLFRTPRLVKTK